MKIFDDIAIVQVTPALPQGESRLCELAPSLTGSVGLSFPEVCQDDKEARVARTLPRRRRRMLPRGIARDQLLRLAQCFLGLAQ